MSFKRKNTKPTRVSDQLCDISQENVSSLPFPHHFTHQEMSNLQHFARTDFFHQQFVGKPSRLPTNQIPGHLEPFPFSHAPRYPGPRMNQPNVDQGNPHQWQVSLALQGANQDLPTMVAHSSGSSSYKWPQDKDPAQGSNEQVENTESENFHNQQTRKWKFSSISPEGNSPGIPHQQEAEKPSQPKKSRKIKFKFQNKAPADVKYKCDVCVYCTNRSDHYKRHLMTHSEDKPLKCSTCGYGTGRSDHFRRHLSRHGLNKEEIVMQCELNGIKTCSSHNRSTGALSTQKSSTRCENTLSVESSDANQLGGGVAVKKHRCVLCGYSTDRSSHYHRHLKTHSDDHPYNCDKCGRKFKLETYLKKHRCSLRPLADERSSPNLSPDVASKVVSGEYTIQNGEEPAQPICAGCGMWFTRFTDLTNHICPHLM